MGCIGCIPTRIFVAKKTTCLSAEVLVNCWLYMLDFLLVKIHLFASYKFQVTAASFNSCWKSAFVCNLSHQWLSRQDMLGVRTHVLWPSQKWSKVVKSKVFIIKMQVEHLSKMWVCWTRGVSDRNLCWCLSHHDPQTSEGWSSKPSQGDHVAMACYDSNMQHQLVHELSYLWDSTIQLRHHWFECPLPYGLPSSGNLPFLPPVRNCVSLSPVIRSFEKCPDSPDFHCLSYVFP